MTAIAAKDGIVAADTLVSDGYEYNTGYRTKIFRYRGGICGAAGITSDCARVRVFLETRGDPEALPEMEERIEILLLDSGGCRIGGGKRPVLVPIRASFWAIGSGAHLALGAMWAGATARAAIEAAIAFDNNSGGEIDVLRLADVQAALQPFDPLAEHAYRGGPTPLPADADRQPIPTIANMHTGGPR